MLDNPTKESASMLCDTPFLEEMLIRAKTAREGQSLNCEDFFFPLRARARSRHRARRVRRNVIFVIAFDIVRPRPPPRDAMRAAASMAQLIAERERILASARSHAPRAVVRLGVQRHRAGAVADRRGGGDFKRIFRARAVTADDNLRARETSRD